MIWIIGGTSETSELLQKIRGRIPYLLMVATPTGKKCLPDDEPVIVARMDRAAMEAFIEEHAIESVVDLTHPYAVELTSNVREACRKHHIRYLRYVRQRAAIENAVVVTSIAACVEFLAHVAGCVFFTTSSKHIKDFQAARGQNRFIYRILPTLSSLEECVKYHVAMRDIVAMVGPISESLNIAMFQGYRAEYVVMKETGNPGGTPSKLNACHTLGIMPVIITRPADDDEISDIQALADIVCRDASRSQSSEISS